MEKTFKKITDLRHLYPVSKTICFRLEPVGKTLENIRKHGLVETDTDIADGLQTAKEVLDRMYRDYIDLSLAGKRLPWGDPSDEGSVAALHARRERKDWAAADATGRRLKKAVAEMFRDTVLPDGTKPAADLTKKAIIDTAGRYAENEEETAALAKAGEYFGLAQTFLNQRAKLFNANEKGNTVPNRTIDNIKTHFANVRLYKRYLEEPDLEALVDECYSRLAETVDAETAEEFFSPSAACLLLTQESIDRYNAVIGGIALNDGTRLKGINETVNEYNTKNGRGKDDRNAVPKMRKLDKQILSERVSRSAGRRHIADDGELREALDELHDNFAAMEPTVRSFRDALLCADPKRVQLTMDDAEKICQLMHAHWYAVKDAIKQETEAAHPKSKRQRADTWEQKIDTLVKKVKSVTAARIDAATEKDTARFCADILDTALKNQEKLFKKMKTALDEKPGEKVRGDEKKILAVKNWTETLLDISRTVHRFTGTGDEDERDGSLYNIFDELDPWCRDNIHYAYNVIRDYLSSKPFSRKKLRLNFNNSHLLSGFDDAKESTNGGVILRKGGNYYIAIANGSGKNIFSEDRWMKDGSDLEKLEVKSLPDVGKQLPHRFFSETWNAVRPIPEKIKKIYFETKNRKREQTPAETEALIAYYQDCIRTDESWKCYNFTFGRPADYQSVKEFSDELTEQSYLYWFAGADEDRITAEADAGRLFLFRIHRQDFSPNAYGRKDLHTLYWDQLFTEENRRDRKFKVCGGAQVYFRKASIPRRVTHRKGDILQNKNPDSANRTRVCPHDLIKDRKYTEDVFMLHLPITMNNSDYMKGKSVNEAVREIVKHDRGMNVLAIDRGERNLLHAVVVDGKGNILEQTPLNIFHNFDYRRALVRRNAERKESQRAWSKVDAVKDLKQGYLNEALYAVTELVRKYGCAVALEKLDCGFKNSRQKFDNNVYSRFETALENKFKYLVDKTADPDEPWGAKEALQLVPQNTQTKGESTPVQQGLIFYVDPWYTSRIDPTTGFANFRTFRYKNLTQAAAEMKSLEAFEYDRGRGMYRIRLDAGRPGQPATSRVADVWTNGIRIEATRDRDSGRNIRRNVDVTKEMTRILADAGIGRDGDIAKEVMEKNSPDLYRELFRVLNLTLQMRNSNYQTEEDWFLSCVMNERGEFFDTRKSDGTLPDCGDANDAYGIARKGLMTLDKIRGTLKGESFDDKLLRIGNAEWLEHVQRGLR